MKATFIHTADWQLGKPFAGIVDSQNRALVQQERLRALERIAAVAAEERAEFMVVAGDLFDSASASKATVAAACAAIGAMRIPVFAIPGNHDHAGQASLWEQPFFRREQQALAPNLRLLFTTDPVECDSAVLFPCPLLRRHESTDTMSHLRTAAGERGPDRFPNKARIVVAHGSVHGFASQPDDEECDSTAVNRLDLDRLPRNTFDYVALGDWHGAMQVNSHAWYSGTPELDRFPKGEHYAAGNVLVVTARRGEIPVVRPVPIARLGWHRLEFKFSGDAEVGVLEEKIDQLIGGRAQQDLLLLELTGALGIEASTRLDHAIESWQSRLLRLKLFNQTTIAPSPAEMESLTRRTADPLISCVASKLFAQTAGDSEEAATARIALRELHALCAHA